MLKIYIATSWKMAYAAIYLAEKLRREGFEVDCFCDVSSGRKVFRCIDKEKKFKKLEVIEFLNEPDVKEAFDENKKWLDWADVCILIIPSGRSAHLEAGYTKGSGKKLYIIGDFEKGNVELMYGFTDGLFKWSELKKLLAELIEEDIKKHKKSVKLPV